MSLRTERVASVIKEEVGMMLTTEFRDPAYGLITVTDVQMSPDLRIAKIYVSVLGPSEQRERTLAMLDGHKPRIRSFIGSKLRLKFTPSVQFHIDETLDRVEKIESIIRKIHEDDRSSGSQQPQ